MTNFSDYGTYDTTIFVLRQCLAVEDLRVGWYNSLKFCVPKTSEITQFGGFGHDHISECLNEGGMFMIRDRLTRIRDIFEAVLENNPAVIGQPHTIQARVKSHRPSGGIGFIACTDGSTFVPCQVVYNNDTAGDFQATIGTGAVIECEGRIVPTPDARQPFDFVADHIRVLGEVADDYPLQKHRIGFEKLREMPHLRPRTNTFDAVFKIRNTLCMAIHNYLQARDFQYITTPIVTTNDAEGAGEAFTVTTRNDGKYDEDFFGCHASLTVSGQLHVEPFALAFGNVYTFGPTFRAENSNTPYHASEFWMIEPEIAPGDLEDNMVLIEGIVKYCITEVLAKHPDEMAFLNKFVDKKHTLIQDLERAASADFKVFTYDDAVRYLQEADRTFEYPVEWGVDLKTEHERYLCEDLAQGPVFIINYPKDIKAFYMRMNDDGKTVAACDLLVPGVGELIGGSQREERYDALIARMHEMHVPTEPLRWYIDLRRFGTIKHAGFGIGLERMMLYLTRIGNIRDTLPYARTPRNCRF